MFGGKLSKKEFTTGISLITLHLTKQKLFLYENHKVLAALCIYGSRTGEKHIAGNKSKFINHFRAEWLLRRKYWVDLAREGLVSSLFM